jgi:hypothetical protein
VMRLRLARCGRWRGSSSTRAKRRRRGKAFMGRWWHGGAKTLPWRLESPPPAAASMVAASGQAAQVRARSSAPDSPQSGRTFHPAVSQFPGRLAEMWHGLCAPCVAPVLA